MLEVEVRDDEHLRQTARTAAYGAWSIVADEGQWRHGPESGPMPLVRVGVTEEASLALVAAWDAL